MNKKDRQLLENVFDALDGLFDRQINVADVYHLLASTDKAISQSVVHLSLAEYVDKLGKIVRENHSEAVKREQALIQTDQLRTVLNDIL